MSRDWPSLSGTPEARPAGWYLETPAEAGRLQRVLIRSVPFRVGRGPGLDLALPDDSVSKRHAEIYAAEDGLRLRDLGSKNGTFVNRALVEDAPIRAGDILHFADFEFRLGRADLAEGPEVEGEQTTVAPSTRELPHGFPGRTRELRDLLREGLVTLVFQPIVLLPRGPVAAYEALGRGLHPDLPESPEQLFQIAQSIGAEAELSRLFRRKAVELARGRTDLPTIFLNTHPIELSRPELLESLEELRALAPHLDLALEIHESVLIRPAQIVELKRLLSERSIALAYDDFGAGQARLLELAENPPHYLKFDQRLVKELDRASSSKRRFIRSLLECASDLRVKSVAEGIETEGELEACRDIGFTHAQGFHLGRPLVIDRV